MKNNIVLIGMPGVGKSTLGVILAKLVGYSFCDTDLVIQQATGKLLREIISDSGIDGFIETENRINSKLYASHSVIATGGSVVYGFEAMQNLRNIGTVVYLKQDFDTISSRLKDIKGRGVVLREGQTLLDLFNERVPLYEKYADITVELKDGSIEDNVEKVMKALEIHQVGGN